jgi:hypothetical protein
VDFDQQNAANMVVEPGNIVWANADFGHQNMRI